MYLKNKLFHLFFFFFLVVSPAQAGLFGISPADRQEFVQARETYNQGDYKQAVALLSDYIYKTKNIKRREARAYRLLGLTYEKLDMPEKALETYKEALAFHEKDIPLLLSAAELYHRTDLTDQSIDLYNQVLKIEPNNLIALSGQAENYIDMGFYSKAREYYDRFFELDPQAPAINRARYAYTFSKQRNYDDALIHITMAKMEEPSVADYWLLSARAYKGLSMPQDALSDLEIAIFLAPQRNELKSIKALWLYQEKQYEDSLKVAQTVLKLEPENELALFTIYLNLMKLNKKQQALELLKRIKNSNNDSFARRVAQHLLN
ncbi:MAG: tetratricopeptide repeat protein [Elusimicrobiaceae bacterium]|nr:tetratricopeptide repeat protein [Elusimicrobiaceae bacterium]